MDRAGKAIFTRGRSSVTWLVTLVGCPLLLVTAQGHRELLPHINSVEGRIADSAGASRDSGADSAAHVVAHRESNEMGLMSLQENVTPAPEIEPTPTIPAAEPTPTPLQPEPTPISPEVEPTTIPELETAAPEGGALGAPELPEEVTEPVEQVPTSEGGGGARWRIAPHIQATVTYDDNIFIQPDHERADFIFTLAPGVMFGYWELEAQRQDFLGETRDADALAQRALGNFLIADYTAYLLGFARTSSENTLDHDGRVAFRWELSKLTLGATLHAESKSEADPDVGNRVKIRRLAIDTTSRYQISEKTTIGLTLSNRVNDPEGFIQTTEWRAEGLAEYAVTPLIQLGLGIAGGRLSVTDGSDQSFEQILARAQYSFSDKLNAQFSGGVEFRQFDTSSSEHTSPVFTLGFDWRPATATQFTLQAFRRTSASALNVDENLTTTGFEATFRRVLSGGLQFSLTGGYYVANYRFVGGNQPRTDNFIFVRPGLLYQFTDRLHAGITYQYRRNESDNHRFQFSNNQVTAEITLRF
jgi:Putative beta-barrel porin 2